MDVVVTNILGRSCKPKEILSVYFQVGLRSFVTIFFIIDASTTYNALLGGDWIHANFRILPSLHNN